MKPTLVVMVKEPRAGRVKTRLGRNIGMTAAAWWMRHQTARLLRRLENPRWHLVLAVAPDTAARSRAWPAHLQRCAQGPGDLGDRMGRVLRSFAPGPVLIIGGDIPGVTTPLIAEAFAALGRCPAVIGPADDGGYWAVGLRHPGRAPTRLFQGVRWSTAHALADTLPTLPQPVARLTTLRDIDTGEDLRHEAR